ncbi:hypothetical protein M1M38_gp111 [Halorubrum tailed virus 27]|uniref:Uncharacterized protein n=1 Tax=Halorubrum tailed virus 27 TaxID=2878008 RepID=A0AAE8Y046_9CAUD|nr:hypothetical protein M1M38_gp111 [Halorubrum tailed virus 27]UBF22804.1 hypothetical protein HRTV-27_gp111 [Halorubrum tailed virus 27]
MKDRKRPTRIRRAERPTPGLPRGDRIPKRSQGLRDFEGPGKPKGTGIGQHRRKLMVLSGFDPGVPRLRGKWVIRP